MFLYYEQVEDCLCFTIIICFIFIDAFGEEVVLQFLLLYSFLGRKCSTDSTVKLQNNNLIKLRKTENRRKNYKLLTIDKLKKMFAAVFF